MSLLVQHVFINLCVVLCRIKNSVWFSLIQGFENATKVRSFKLGRELGDFDKTKPVNFKTVSATFLQY